MTMHRKLTAGAGALLFSVGAAFAQAEQTAPAEPPEQQQPGEMPSEAMRDEMREMMREMMQDMMRQEMRQAEEERAERPRFRRQDGDRMGRRGMREGRHMRRGDDDGRPPRARHAGGMRIMFAVVDANGDGALSLEEAQDFQERIFDGIDEDGDGRVTMTEIEAFFHRRD